jgi:DNA-binding NtrC family response regulator
MDKNKNQRSEACKNLLEFAAWHGPDIEALAVDSLARLAERGLPAKRLSAQALEALGGYAWPGGIGELAMVLERAVVLSASKLPSPARRGL